MHIVCGTCEHNINGAVNAALIFLLACFLVNLKLWPKKECNWVVREPILQSVSV